MAFNTHYNRVQSKPEENTGKNLVETHGYIPAVVQIRNIMDAGRRLTEYRKEQYDFAVANVDESYFASRSHYYDKVTAMETMQEITERVENSQTASEKTEPNQVEKSQAEPSKVEKSQAEPSQAE